MSQPNPSIALGRALIDELARNGVDFVVSSPGSRSAALAIAAVEHPGIETRVVIDERSAAFHALGRAKATGVPAAVVSTSGTAPANYLPAVVEADMSLTPLVVVSADRPAELRGVGANQTIDQVHLYGERVRFFADIEAPDASRDLNGTWRSTGWEAVARSRGERGRPGPVHLNVAFREPTVPVSDDGRSSAPPYGFSIEGRDGGRPWHQPEDHAPEHPDFEIEGSSRGLVIAGEGDYDRAGVLETAGALGWPVLATASSGLRGTGVVDTYHHLLAGDLGDALRPDLVYAVGAIGPSQRLEDLVAMAAQRIRIDPWGRRLDPRRNATHVLAGDPVKTLERLIPTVDLDPTWRGGWIEAGSAVRSAISIYLDGLTEPTGAGVAHSLNGVPFESLVAASSLPIREVDAHVTRQVRVIANRGASGIDGFVSTALGVSSADRQTLALSGDLSLYHDSNGFLCDLSDDLLIVVLDNGGGGLFDALPPARHAPDYERLFVAPPDRDLEELARFHRISYTVAKSSEVVAEKASEMMGKQGVSLIRVPIDRETDLATREMLDEIGRSTVGSLQL